MRKFDHIVWDWNGTLLDDAGVCVDIMNKMLLRRSLPSITMDYYTAVIEFPVERYYRKLGFDFDAEVFETVSDEYVALYEAGWRNCSLQSGAMDTLLRLKEAGIGQSVLSASKSAYLLEQLDFFGISPLLGVVTGADNHHGLGKLQLARRHVDTVGMDPSRVLFVGDTQHDAEVAHEAGCPCLLVSFGHYSRPRLAHLGAPVAQNMQEVAEYILS